MNRMDRLIERWNSGGLGGGEVVELVEMLLKERGR